MATKKKPEIKRAGPAKSTGFGESKIFAAPEGSFPKAEGEIEILDCHVAGMSVRDLPRDSQLRILYQQTDEGIAWYEANRHKLENRDAPAGPQGRGMRVAGLGEATDEEDKLLVKYRDELAADNDGLHLATDPFADVVAENVPPGFRGLMMSERQCKDKGMVRGVLKYEKLLKKDPATGRMEPVTIGGMFLGVVPEVTAQKAERHYARLQAEKQVSAVEKVTEQTERVMSGRDMQNVAKKRHVLEDLIGLETEDPERADAELIHEFVESGT